MRLQQVIFLCTAVQLTLCAEMPLDNLRQQNSNSSESPQKAEESIDAIIASVFGTSQPPRPTQPTPVVNPGCKCVPYYLCNLTDATFESSSIIDPTESRSYCSSYLDVCCKEGNTMTIAADLFPVRKRKSNCGQRNIDGIGFVNDALKAYNSSEETESLFGEFPWMVAIFQAESDENETTSLNAYQCGGALIHSQVVLTAAHCVLGKDVKKLKAHAGEWDIQINGEIYLHQDRSVKEIVVHEDYYAAEFHNDIALLIMESPFDITDTVDIVCLPDEEEIMDGRQCVVSGWEKGKKGRYKGILKKIELPVVPRKLCEEALSKTILGQSFKLHESLICAGNEPGRGVCESDFGCPLACPSQNNSQKYRQAGIAAWGIDFGKDTPGTYVNIPFFKGWITSKLKSYHLPE